MYVTSTFITESTLSCYLCTTVLMDSQSESNLLDWLLFNYKAMPTNDMCDYSCCIKAVELV